MDLGPEDSGGPCDSLESTQCAWKDCTRILPDPDALYAHLCEEHVGRKSKGIQCLECHWKGCTITQTFSKRDHVTSHLRVHVELKPYRCNQCEKRFKRRQDLRKHIKTHEPSEDLSSSSSSSSSPTKSSSATPPPTSKSSRKHSRTAAEEAQQVPGTFLSFSLSLSLSLSLTLFFFLFLLIPIPFSPSLF
ncbi:MAG: hypothetical protein DHS80DRAFT_15092 [Piptocephalis tieghemiana]|nr:MAG: hypothetical protein DHS80DRAFT_15092 [Piptocephalis tieghemiana]